MAVDMTVRKAKSSVSEPPAAPKRPRGRPRKDASTDTSPDPQPAALALVESAVAGRTIAELWHALPAPEWQRILDAQPIDSPGGRLAAVRTDPRWRESSLERQCAEAGVSATELARMVSGVALSTALIASTKHLAAVVNGVGEGAKPLILTCDLCLGLRDAEDQPTTVEVAHPRDASQKLKISCPQCGGMGTRHRNADPRTVEMFLKLHGGLEEPQGPAIQLNQQFNFGSQHAMGVHRGQELLERGRRKGPAQSSPSQPVTVTATVVDAESPR